MTAHATRVTARTARLFGHIVLFAALSPPLTASAATPTILPTITVTGSAPTAGAPLSDARYPAHVQRFESPRDTRAVGLADFLGRSAGGVVLSDAAGNPLQTDLFYRGYSASPLLGLPQGLAMYQDGVRINEPFGDTMHWDLVPMAAIRSIALAPGASPGHGRNALGGALIMETWNGWDRPGAAAELAYGSFGRLVGSVTYGLAAERFALFAAVEGAEDGGWRDHSRSTVQRAFVKGSWAEGRNAVDLAVTTAHNRLLGNGAVPQALLREEGRAAVFTHPDRTEPQLLFVQLSGSRRLSADAQLRAGAYLRHNRIDTLNGDGTEYAPCEEPGNGGPGGPFLCGTDDGEEEVVVDDGGAPVPATGATSTATLNTSRTDQDGHGISLQFDAATRLAGRALRWNAGLAYDEALSRFDSQTELARLTGDRGADGSGLRDAGAAVGVDARSDVAAVHAAAAWDFAARFTLTASARYERQRIRLDDRIGTALDGDHRFSRLNPMLALSFEPVAGLVSYVSLAQASRTPTPVELTCADPEDPCRLPNSFVSDPPLEQVLSRSVEAGMRGHHAQLRWHAAVFYSRAARDILFITDGDLTNEGYFDNVGDTARDGVELGVDYDLTSRLALSLDYGFVRAEFRDPFLVNTPHHPLRENGEPIDAVREVRSGDRIPLIPRHVLRAALDWRGERLTAGLNVLARSSAPYRGDESNLDPQRIGGFAVVNAELQWQATPALMLFAGVDNLLDTGYETFGVYGEADEVLGEDYEDARRFVAPGAPRTAFLGLRAEWR